MGRQSEGGEEADATDGRGRQLGLEVWELMASGAAVLVEPRGCESSVGVVSKQYMTGEIGKRGNNSFCQLCPKGKKIEGW